MASVGSSEVGATGTDVSEAVTTCVSPVAMVMTFRAVLRQREAVFQAEAAGGSAGRETQCGAAACWRGTLASIRVEETEKGVEVVAMALEEAAEPEKYMYLFYITIFIVTKTLNSLPLLSALFSLLSYPPHCLCFFVFHLSLI